MKRSIQLLLVCAPIISAYIASGAIFYVDSNSADPTPPYDTWGTAARDIQSAIDVAAEFDTILVTNGIYGAGGRLIPPGTLTNRVALDKPVQVRSVNGPEVTLIKGYQVPDAINGPSATRCAYLVDGAVLSGFTLTAGGVFAEGDETDQLGAGVWCASTNALVINCILSSNVVAQPLYGGGGGAFSGTFSNCTFRGNVAATGGAALNSFLVGCNLQANQAQGGGGGLAGGTAIDCFFGGNSAIYGGGAANSFLINCTLTNNYAVDSGGAATVGTLKDCVLLNNEAGKTGGAASLSDLTGCMVVGNRAVLNGGGCSASTLTNSVLSTNSSRFGGGAFGGLLENCKLIGNTAYYAGGGGCSNTLINCAVTGNYAVKTGGGSVGGSLSHCTVSGNYARQAGGTADSVLVNSLVYYNRAALDENYLGGSFDHCCTTPLPLSGAGNIDKDPRLVDGFHLGSDSPCIAAGKPLGESRDIDGQPWAPLPAIGCDEPVIGAGDLAVELLADHPNLTMGRSVRFAINVSGAADRNVWNLGDGTWHTNQAFVEHAYAAPGQFTVTVQVSNSNRTAVDSELITVAAEPVHYVSPLSQNPIPPYSSWDTAALNIQDAVDHAFLGATVMVTNGIYRAGGRPVLGTLTNRVAVTKALTLKSVNGPETTVIEGEKEPDLHAGARSVRGVHLADGAVLDGFTVTNGSTRYSLNVASPEIEESGGGIWCESTNVLVLNSVIVSNASSHLGSGIFSGTVKHSQIVKNWNVANLFAGGGGAALSVLVDSTVSGNRTGAKSCLMVRCLVYGNNEGTSESTLMDCDVYANSNVGLSKGSAVESRIYGNQGGATFATLTNCFIYENRALNGGGCYNSVLYSCTVSNNYATNFGGGVYWSGAVQNCGTGNLVISNKAGLTGGGMFLQSPSSLTNWVFRYNGAAGGDAGGLQAAGSGLMTLSGCSFVGNTATGNGGGFSSQVGDMKTAIDCTFSNNVAGGLGGGAYGTRLVRCTLSGNRALRGGGSAGGAINACAFYTNSAVGDGGGYFAATSYDLIADCHFVGNMAGTGGALAFSAGAVSNCVFTANAAITNGGALYLQNPIPIRRSTFTGNNARFGGAGYNGSYSNCEFRDNHALVDGGAVYQSLQTSVGSTNCLVVGNTATGNGGGVLGGTWIKSRFVDNHAGGSGGAAYRSVVGNTVIEENTAVLGGGVALGNVTQSLLTGNRAQTGGAVYNSNSHAVNNCTIIGNFATNSAGGVFSTPNGMALLSSIVYFNSAPLSNNYSGTLNNFSCLFPIPTGGNGNIADDPLLIAPAEGNFRLKASSPCINAGNGNPGSTDLDGRGRVVGGRIDMGAYEFQAAGVGEFTHWLGIHGLPTGGVADYEDTDLDRMNNWQEWKAGTAPTDPDSVLRLLAPTVMSAGVLVSWQSVAGKSYIVERTSDPANVASFEVLQAGIAGQEGVTTFADSAPRSAPTFYRVAVE
jgi:hypothetical protein